ncbi:SPFH domain-containing protein [Mycoplasmopsis cricetuli]|uniref:SPFH domain-containing protein n=1 Tax=Mycoplasmopsis cricetuli TaxID=171283 RepID=UPI0004710154|nr:SPFH domain-containing protein [Mycoplasmopsis cricetuli]
MIGLIIGLSILFSILFAIIVIVASKIKIVSQSDFYIVERMGKYHKTLKTGISVLIPFIDRVILRENYKEKVLDFPAQDVITKDNATIKVDTVIYYQITDPKLYAYGAENPVRAIEILSSTTLRNLLGELELDETLTSRDNVNAKLTSILDTASDSWGIKVHRVELKNIIPPFEIQTAMEKQMRAEREKRALILEAEGRKQALILNASANKESAILEAEGVKQAKILEAEGQRKALELINSVQISSNVLTLRSLEELGKLGNGQATKIILPPNLTNVAQYMAAGAEIFNLKDKTNK